MPEVIHPQVTPPTLVELGAVEEAPTELLAQARKQGEWVPISPTAMPICYPVSGASNYTGSDSYLIAYGAELAEFLTDPTAVTVAEINSLSANRFFLGQLRSVTALTIVNTLATTIDGIDDCPLLVSLSLIDNALLTSISSINTFGITGLNSITINGSPSLSELPLIGDFSGLMTLDISDTGITEIPPTIAAIGNLTSLTAKNIIYFDPSAVTSLPFLSYVDLRNNLMSQGTVDAVISTLEAGIVTNGELYLTGNNTPSAGAAADIASLIADGWIVVTD